MFPLMYLDPGTGSLLLYALVGVTATAFFALRGAWYSIKGLFVRGSGSNELPREIPSLVIHSEGAKYWQVFQPLIGELDKRGIPCAYITPERKDFDLADEFDTVTAVHPGNEMATIAYMNKIRADMVITTTPHLDIYMLKRSKNVKTYVHLVHSPTSVDFYEMFAFNRFDVILSPGPFMEPYIRELEQMWQLPPKKVIPVGCTYYDYMARLRDKSSSQKSNRTTVLYAPTWGKRSSALKYGLDLFNALSKGDFDVIFRPHPQFYVSHMKEIREIELWMEQRPTFSLDRNQTGLESMEKADIMITDLSGVLFDYAYLYEKPILMMDVEISLEGFEGEGLSCCWDKEMSESLSRVISKNDLAHLADIVGETLINSTDITRKIRQLRDQELTGFKASSPLAAAAIQELIEAL